MSQNTSTSKLTNALNDLILYNAIHIRYSNVYSVIFQSHTHAGAGFVCFQILYHASPSNPLRCEVNGTALTNSTFTNLIGWRHLSTFAPDIPLIRDRDGGGFSSRMWEQADFFEGSVGVNICRVFPHSLQSWLLLFLWGLLFCIASGQNAINYHCWCVLKMFIVYWRKLLR